MRLSQAQVEAMLKIASDASNYYKVAARTRRSLATKGLVDMAYPFVGLTSWGHAWVSGYRQGALAR